MDNRSAAAGDAQGNRVLRAREHAFEIRAEYPFPRFFRQLGRRTVVPTQEDRGVVVQNVQTSVEPAGYGEPIPEDVLKTKQAGVAVVFARVPSYQRVTSIPTSAP